MKPELATHAEYQSRARTQHSWMMRGHLFVLAPDSIYHWAGLPSQEEQTEYLALRKEILTWVDGKGVETHSSGWTFWISIEDPQKVIEFKLIFC